MSNETKTPQADEWWVNSKGYIRYIIGLKRSGSIVWEDSTGWSFANDNSDWNDWHHEPRCTGFDWTEPPAIDPGEGWELLPVGTMLQDGDECFFNGTWHELNRIFSGTVYDTEDKNHYRRRKQTAEQWPKYFIHSDQTWRWYIKRISETNCQYVSCSGEHDSDEWTGYSDHLVDSGTWREVTEAEALARVKPAEPATADRVPDHRPAREVIMDIVSWLDEKDGEIASPCMALETAQQWLDDNPEDPPPFAKPFTNSRSGTGIPKNNAPVELPDDWVDLPETHILRADIDQVLYEHDTINYWQEVCPSAGMRLNDSQYKRARCRRRDLPAPQPKTMDVSPGEGWRWVEKDEPWQEGDDCLICDFKHAHTHNCQCWRRRIVPQPKRIPVRLYWYDGKIVGRYDHSPPTDPSFQEIKFDGSGFFVEGE